MPEMRDFLLTLQQNLANRVESPGDIPFNGYRALKTEVRQNEEPLRIVDGELVERYLDLSTEVQQAAVQGIMMKGTQVTMEQTRAIIESLRRLH
jgi:DNA damage-binding protein 1